jgi:hypothetical protein
MTNERWLYVYRILMKAARVKKRKPGRPFMYSCGVVAWLSLWGAYHQWPISELANQLKVNGWPKPIQPFIESPPPSLSTLSRRFKRPEIIALMNRALRTLDKGGTWGAIDGTPLPVGRYSTDADARFGGRGTHYHRAYKLVDIVNQHGQPIAVTVVRGNTSELAAGRWLVDYLARVGRTMHTLVGDKGFDSEPFHSLVRQKIRGRLIAPVIKTRGRRPRNAGRNRVVGGLFRRASDRLLRSTWGRCWRRRRKLVERINGLFKQRPHCLYALPAFVRHIHTVGRWVLSHAVLLSLKQVDKDALKAA